MPPPAYPQPAADDTKAEVERLKKRVEELEKAKYPQAPKARPMMQQYAPPPSWDSGGMQRP